jgi:hypothetical protein
MHVRSIKLCLCVGPSARVCVKVKGTMAAQSPLPGVGEASKCLDCCLVPSVSLFGFLLCPVSPVLLVSQNLLAASVTLSLSASSLSSARAHQTETAQQPCHMFCHHLVLPSLTHLPDSGHPRSPGRCRVLRSRFAFTAHCTPPSPSTRAKTPPHLPQKTPSFPATVKHLRHQ